MSSNTTLALIHTSPVLVPVFTQAAAGILRGTTTFHVVDESLIANTIRAGSLQKSTIRRLVNQVDSARQAGADAVLVTCSSIGPGVDVARQLFDFPVLRVDERMAEQAVSAGGRIGVLATLRTTLEPTVALLQTTAARSGKSADVVSHLCDGAFEAVTNGDVQTHDAMVAAGLRTLAAATNLIVLAQASMARIVDRMSGELSGVTILSSPRLAIEQARETLERLRIAGAESRP